MCFLDPIDSICIKNDFIMVPQKKIASYLRQCGLKKPFLRGFKPKPKSAFFTLGKKGDFQDPFLILYSFMGNYGMQMILIGVLVP